MKKIFIIIVIVIIALVGISIARDLLIKNIITVVASSLTGAPVRVGSFSMSIIRQSVRIANFKIYNPKGFPPGVLLDCPKIAVVSDIGALFTGRLHLKRLDFELKELGLVKNKEGNLNVDSLKISQEGERPKEREPKKATKRMPIAIDLMNLKIERVVDKDYSVSGPPLIKVYDIKLKKTYKNITSPEQLAVIIISEPLKAAGVRGLKIYGVAMLTGVAALPVSAAFTVAGKDYARADFNVPVDRAYDAGLKVLKNSGIVKKEDRATGTINAEIGGAQVTLKVQKLAGKAAQVTVSARKYMLPKPQIAAGVLYGITDELR